MAQNAEANLLITIKEKGKEALSGVKAGLDTIVDSAAKVGAALLATGVAIGKLAKDASAFGEIETAFKNLARSQGANSDQILKNLQKASGGILSQVDLLKTANEALLAGIPIDKLDKIVKLAKAAANSTGESVENMTSSIISGLARGSTMMLRHVGIVFDADEAYKKYARSLGFSEEKLTDAEKKQVFLNEALSRGDQILAKLGPDSLSASDKMERFTATLKNISISAGKFAIPVFESLVDTFQSWADVIEVALNSHYADSFFREIELGAVSAYGKVKSFFTLFAGAISGNAAEAAKESIEIQAETERKRQEIVLKYKQESNENIKKYDDNKNLDDLAREQKKQEDIKDLENKAAEDRKRRAEEEAKELKKLKEEHEKTIKTIATNVQAFTSGGLQNLTSQTLGFIADTFLPGIGSAVTQVFNLLSQNTDQFRETLKTLFSTEFIKNVSDNLQLLIKEMPTIVTEIMNFISKNSPAIVESLVAAIIANIPAMTSTLVKAMVNMMADPKFHLNMAAAIAKGFAQGVKDAAGDLKDAIAKAFRDAIGIAGGGGGGGIGGVLGDIGGAIAGVGKSIISFGRYQGGIIPAYAGGGLIDNRIARVSAGEYIVNKDATSANRSLLEDINNSRGRSIGQSASIVINVNGGLLGDRDSARMLALAVDEELYRLRLGNESRAFDRSLY